jgi:hypothetical protein
MPAITSVAAVARPTWWAPVTLMKQYCLPPLGLAEPG